MEKDVKSNGSMIAFYFFCYVSVVGRSKKLFFKFSWYTPFKISFSTESSVEFYVEYDKFFDLRQNLNQKNETPNFHAELVIAEICQRVQVLLLLSLVLLIFKKKLK